MKDLIAFAGKMYTSDDVGDIIVVLSPKELHAIRAAASFLRETTGAAHVAITAHKVYTTPALDGILGEDAHEEHDQNNWSPIPLRHLRKHKDLLVRTRDTSSTTLLVSAPRRMGGIEVHVQVDYGAHGAMAALVYSGSLAILSRIVNNGGNP